MTDSIVSAALLPGGSLDGDSQLRLVRDKRYAGERTPPNTQAKASDASTGLWTIVTFVPPPAGPMDGIAT
jgi:hypothetical protein